MSLILENSSGENSMTRVALLLGAGFSCTFGYPTTKQFFEKFGKNIEQESQRNLLELIRQDKEVKDIEHVLSALDSLLELNSNKTATSLLADITEIKINKSSFNWRRFSEIVEGLKSTIIDKIYDEYHHKLSTRKDAFPAIEKLFAAVTLSKKSNITMNDVFTLNYDRLMEEYLLTKPDIDLVDGFQNEKGGRNFWTRGYFLLHGTMKRP